MGREGIINIADNAVYDKDCFYVPKQFDDCVESVLIPHGMIVDRVAKLAHDIYTDHNDASLVVLCAQPFFASLIDQLMNYNLDFSYEFVKVKSYEGTSSSGNVSISGIDVSTLKGKNVLIVEDIIDTGITMSRLVPYLKESGVSTINVAALLEKRTPLSCGFKADYCGFSIPDKFVIGFGLDYNQQLRCINHICIITKEEEKNQLKSYCKSQQMNVIFTSHINRSNINSILSTMVQITPPKFKISGCYYMICGIPNVGKSTIINDMLKCYNDTRNKKGVKVAGQPGVTKTIHPIKVHVNPDIYLYDTPGIFIPNIQQNEVGLKLALIGSVKDRIVGEDILADYLLYLLNKKEQFKYVQLLNLKAPTDNIVDIQNVIYGKSKKSPLEANQQLIKMYRLGQLGKFIIDDLKL
ncbi:hypothetical protein WA158_004511 [Blastocystis sp. Blastoise]